MLDAVSFSESSVPIYWTV